MLTPLPETLNKVETTPDAPRVDLDQHPIPHNFMEDMIKTRIAELTDGDIRENGLELDSILRWAQNKGASEPEQVFQEVRDLITRLGSAAVGEKLVSKMNRYVFFENEKFEADKALREMERE